MGFFKKIIGVLILLLVVVAAWVGLTAYSASTNVDLDPNAASYVSTINPTFKTTGYENLKKKIEEGLLVAPSVFHELKNDAVILSDEKKTN